MDLENAVVTKTGFCKPIANPVRPIQSPNDLTSKNKVVISSPNDISVVNKGVIQSPNDLTEIQKTDISAPNVLTAKPYSDLPPFPETHGRILYDNLLLESTDITANRGAGANLTLTPNTFEGWSATNDITSSTITFTLPANVSMDTFCFGAQNLKNKNTTYVFQTSDTTGGSFTSIGSPELVESNSPKMKIETRDVRRVRLVITGTTGLDFNINLISAGNSLQLQRPMYSGVRPAQLNAVTDYFNNRSESGEWLGRTIRRRGFETSIDMKRITPQWYREYFSPFVESIKTTPFFYSWRPQDYPDDVVYCWTDSDIKPSNSGIREFMDLSFNVNCHGFE